MSVLFWLRYSVRSLRRSGRRAAFALVCVMVGVASVVALQTATLTVRTALTSNVRAANGGDISVVSDASPISTRDLSIFRKMQRAGQLSAWTAVYSVHATAVGPAHALVPFDVRVATVPPYPLGGEPTFVMPSNGTVAGLLRVHGDVLMTSVLADELGAHVGDRLVVNSLRGTGLHVTVRGILAETSFEHSAVMTVESRDAAALTASAPRYTEVYANVRGDAATIATTLRRHFPVATVQTVQEALQTTEAEVHDFSQFMLLVGLLALLVAGIGILNAMQSILAWRRLEIAMLKALGFPVSTLYGVFGGEALLLGVTGGVLGTVLGALTSKLITDALARALAIQVTFVLDGGTLLGGVALGAGATLIFAVLPIVRAAGYRPLEILREGAGAPRATGAVQVIVLVAIVIVLFGALVAAIMGNAALAAEFMAGVVGAFLLLTGIFAALIAWMSRLGRPATRSVGFGVLIALVAATILAGLRLPAIAALLALGTILWAATLLPGSGLLPLLIAARSLSRRRARTSVTLVAFLVGVLAMSITLTVALSLQQQITDALASNGSTNLVAIADPTSEAAVLAQGHRLPGVQSTNVTVVVSTTPTKLNGQPIGSIIGYAPRPGRDDDRDWLFGGVTGIDLGAGAQPDRIKVVAGRSLGPADTGTNNVLVRRNLLEPPWNLGQGSTVTLQEATTGRTRMATIVGFYSRQRRRGFASFFTPPVIADRSFALALGGPDVQAIVGFTVDSNQLTHDATMLQARVPGILVIDVGDLTRIIDTILGELLNLLGVITVLSLGAGLAVVGNGVALAMLERRREIALYKAIGFAPATVMRFVLVENALAGTLAGATSVVAVVATLSILSRLALDKAIGFDPVVATLVLIISALLAVGTAYLAARKPIAIRPIEALRNE